MRKIFTIVIISVIALVSGCAEQIAFNRIDRAEPVEQETAYIVPFASTLVPESVSEAVFNDLVDALNDRRPVKGINYYTILKDPVTSLKKEWLERQLYISGEIWSYQENSGCCSTELKIRARLTINDNPAQKAPKVVVIPVDRFFEHDYSTLERERELLAHDLSKALFIALLDELKKQGQTNKQLNQNN